MYIAVDFDGTLVEHAYPRLGTELPRAFHFLSALQSLGVKLILFTMRDGVHLEAAVEFCRSKGIEFFGVNNNPDQTWSDSRKVFAQLYIDDAGAGCPLIFPAEPNRRPFVDWDKLGPSVVEMAARAVSRGG